MTIKLFFARHGESEANVAKTLSSRLGMYGLTDRGKRQAEQLADNLKGIDFAALYSSPILRAIQTAEILARRFGVAYQIEDALREYDVGSLDGRSDEASWTRYREVLVRWMEGKDWDTGVEGGESYNDIQRRFMPFIKRLEDEYQKSDVNILLVGHAGTYKCMLPLLLANVDHAFCQANRIETSGYVVAQWRGSQWVCLQWGEKILAD